MYPLESEELLGSTTGLDTMNRSKGGFGIRIADNDDELLST